MSELAAELHARYLARAELFWKYVKDARFAQLQHMARKTAWMKLDWDWTALGITVAGRTAAETFGFVPAEVFAHPDAVQAEPALLEYYRLLACLPKKGLAQIKSAHKQDRGRGICILLNGFVSKLLSSSGKVSREILLRTVYAEAGSEWQGTWVNNIGKLSARELERILTAYAQSHGLLDETATRALTGTENALVFKSGGKMRFGAEPDVECRDKKNGLVCVIEVKGSADKAGAQTRLGETKKSFTKAKLENPRCITIFLPSVVTTAVTKQLKTERDIDKIYNLLDIFKSPTAQKEFLTELFMFILREQK